MADAKSIREQESGLETCVDSAPLIDPVRRTMAEDLSEFSEWVEDQRIPLSCDRLDFPTFTCQDITLSSNDGASGLVYQATSPNFYGMESAAAANLIVKECYPLEVAPHLERIGNEIRLREDAPEFAIQSYSRYLGKFNHAFETHTQLYQGKAHGYVSVPVRALTANGTMYLASDMSHGQTLDHAVEKMDLACKLRTLLSLCDAVEAVHASGYCCLDIKPTNILALGTGSVQLFDFDTALAIDGIDPVGTWASGSACWSAYELTHHGYNHLIGPRSDLYSLGALAFWLATGTPPSGNEVIHADGHWNIDRIGQWSDDFAGMRNNSRELFAKILDHTLTVHPDDRYADVGELRADLALFASLMDPDAVELQDLVDVVSEAKGELTGLTEQSRQRIRENTQAVMDKQRKTGRKRLILEVAGAILALIVVLIAWLAPSPLQDDPITGSWTAVSNGYIANTDDWEQTVVKMLCPNTDATAPSPNETGDGKENASGYLGFLEPQKITDGFFGMIPFSGENPVLLQATNKGELRMTMGSNAQNPSGTWDYIGKKKTSQGTIRLYRAHVTDFKELTGGQDCLCAVFDGMAPDELTNLNPRNDYSQILVFITPYDKPGEVPATTSSGEEITLMYTAGIFAMVRS